MLARPGPNRHVELSILMGVSACLLGIRLYATSRVGFGDSEALYAAYALHPQPAYLDHPGLVGVVARAIGGGTAPEEQRAHVVTSILSTLLPWGMALTCRSCGASWRRSFAAALVFALVPEVALGLFALTPDLLLALAWTGALAVAADALRSKPGSARSAADFVAAGLLAGVAAASKATGVMLMAALMVTYASRAARPHARTVAPWLGLAAGCLVLSPVVLFEAHRGWPMIRHRLVDSQAGAGVSMHNAAAVVGGQLAYLSPLVVVLAWRAWRELWRCRGDVRGALLLSCCFVPLAALLPLCLWSRVAEPHWLAPALLALVPAAARAPAKERAREARSSLRLVASSCALSGAIVAAVYAWVLVPSLSRLVPPNDVRLDIANELHGWPDALHALRDEIHQFDRLPPDARPDVAVVGPHWVICAQVDAALRGDVPVGCNTPIRDDFDDWLPRDRWRTADVILWISDARFGDPPDLSTHATVRTHEVAVERAGRTVRTFTIAVLVRHAAADVGRGQERPATVLKGPWPSIETRSLRPWLSSLPGARRPLPNPPPTTAVSGSAWSTPMPASVRPVRPIVTPIRRNQAALARRTTRADFAATQPASLDRA